MTTTSEPTTEKTSDGLYILTGPDRTISFQPDLPTIAIHTTTLIEGMHPFPEDCTLTGEQRYCAGYHAPGDDLHDAWLHSGINDQVIWDELRRWLDSDEPVKQELADEETRRRNRAKGHWR